MIATIQVNSQTRKLSSLSGKNHEAAHLTQAIDRVCEASDLGAGQCTNPNPGKHLGQMQQDLKS